MATELTKLEVERLFLAAADQALDEGDAIRLHTLLNHDPELNLRFNKYQQTIGLLRNAPREKAPMPLATVIMRRVRRRRLWGLKSLHTANTDYRVPVEVIIPILLGVLVAVLLLLGAP